jgi:DNA-binding NarL/FixJ family response regulator
MVLAFMTVLQTLLLMTKPGSSGYILKRSDPREIVTAIEDGIRRRSPMTSSIGRKVVESFRESSAPKDGKDTLSPREMEVLEVLSQSLSNKKIAEHLNINMETVRWHLKQIHEKLHVHSRTKVVLKFLGMQEQEG